MYVDSVLFELRPSSENSFLLTAQERPMKNIQPINKIDAFKKSVQSKECFYQYLRALNSSISVFI